MTTLELINYAEEIGKELGYDGPHYMDWSEWESCNHDDTWSDGYWFSKDGKEVNIFWNKELNEEQDNYDIIDEGCIFTRMTHIVRLSTKEKIKNLFLNNLDISKL